jgi:hypothetical protein
MSRRRVCDIIERFACDRDYMFLANFELFGCFEIERKALHRPAENSLPNFTPFGANGNFSTNGSDSVSGGIFERDVNVTVCFDFCANDAPLESVPLCSDGILASDVPVNSTFGPGPSHS